MLRESGMRSQGAIEQPSPGAREQRREANEAQKKRRAGARRSKVVTRSSRRAWSPAGELLI